MFCGGRDLRTMSSTVLPNVALTSPPINSPMWSRSWSDESDTSADSGMMAAILNSSVASEFHSNSPKTMPSGMKINSQPVPLSRRALVAAWKTCPLWCSPDSTVFRRRRRGRLFSPSKGCDSSKDKFPASIMKITAPLAAVDFVLSIEFGVVRGVRLGWSGLLKVCQAKHIVNADYRLAGSHYSGHGHQHCHLIYGREEGWNSPTRAPDGEHL